MCTFPKREEAPFIFSPTTLTLETVWHIWNLGPFIFVCYYISHGLLIPFPPTATHSVPSSTAIARGFAAPSDWHVACTPNPPASRYPPISLHPPHPSLAHPANPVRCSSSQYAYTPSGLACWHPSSQATQVTISYFGPYRLNSTPRALSSDNGPEFKNNRAKKNKLFG
jgi:hypothetical protein